MERGSIGVWILVGAAVAFALVPMAGAMSHHSASPVTTADLSMMGHGDDCKKVGNDDSNGVGNDDDHDHDCAEEGGP
jgi:hypothetical protein